jgi:crotonobetainyl-CoA:carnitine CoA-transferase CaiB-like acyl-CoA transferase
MRSGARLPNSAPNTLFPTRDGSHIHIAALADTVFRRLAGVMDQPELGTDPRFADQNARNRNEAELEALISEWTQSRDLVELQQALDQADVPASRIFTMADIYQDAHYRARDMLKSVPDDDLGSVTLAGVVPKLSLTPGDIRWSGRRTGQDTRTILRRLANLSDAEIDRLHRTGVVHCDTHAAHAVAGTGASAAAFDSL